MTTGQKVWVSIITVLCILTLFLCLDNNQAWRSLFDRENEESTQVIQSQIEEQVEAENPSIVEYLQYIDQLEEDKRKENVLFTIPKVVIVNILQDIGTSISPYELVDIYENYPNIYNSVKSGAKSQQYLDSIMKFEPNTLPKQAPIDSVIESWNDL